LNRADFQQLADVRLQEAGILLSQGCFDGAYYLAGYAVECALKACIARLTQEHDFPDRDFARDCFTHDLDKLVKLAGLESTRDVDIKANSALRINWTVVKDWTETSRYTRNAATLAQQLYEAVADPVDGTLQWVKQYW
jgi:hypothetical protein